MSESPVVSRWVACSLWNLTALKALEGDEEFVSGMRMSQCR